MWYNVTNYLSLLYEFINFFSSLTICHMPHIRIVTTLWSYICSYKKLVGNIFLSHYYHWNKVGLTELLKLKEKKKKRLMVGWITRRIEVWRSTRRERLILGPNCLTQHQDKLGLDWISLIILLGLCFGPKKGLIRAGKLPHQHGRDQRYSCTRQ